MPRRRRIKEPITREGAPLSKDPYSPKGKGTQRSLADILGARTTQSSYDRALGRYGGPTRSGFQPSQETNPGRPAQKPTAIGQPFRTNRRRNPTRRYT